MRGQTFLLATLHYPLTTAFKASFCAYQIARPWCKRGKDNLIFFVGLLYTRHFKVFQDHFGKVPLFSITGFWFCYAID
jgi:hypothetical protein